MLFLWKEICKKRVCYLQGNDGNLRAGIRPRLAVAVRQREDNGSFFDDEERLQRLRSKTWDPELDKASTKVFKQKNQTIKPNDPALGASQGPMLKCALMRLAMAFPTELKLGVEVGATSEMKIKVEFIRTVHMSCKKIKAEKTFLKSGTMSEEAAAEPQAAAENFRIFFAKLDITSCDHGFFLLFLNLMMLCAEVIELKQRSHLKTAEEEPGWLVDIFCVPAVGSPCGVCLEEGPRMAGIWLEESGSSTLARRLCISAPTLAVGAQISTYVTKRWATHNT